ncbi:c-type cytochrome [Tateyamaria sp. SN3-11]|uniref:c-type cytochrome n=1 Tax=Tateyamaria sp. SN3-11 TaxID=3092147 RepID=UPI0039E979DD
MIRWCAILALIGAPALADHELLGRDIAAGQVLYQAQCAACHGAALEGQPDWRVPNDDGTLPAPPHDESGHTWHHDNVLLFEYTKLGGRGALAVRGIEDFNSAMPAFDGVISDDEIWDILAFIRSTWPEQVQQMQASRNPPH